MRPARIFLIGVLALAGIVLLAAWQVPPRLDWNRYRTTIEALASASLGRPVAIAGRITLALLPEPQLEAAEVVIGSWTAGTDARPPLRMASLRLRVAPLPLLLGRVDARELVLRGPDLAVTWPLAPGELAGWPPSWLDAFSARIEDGRLRIGDLQFTAINATLATSDDAAAAAPMLDPEAESGVGAGTLHAVGTAEAGGHRLRFSARLAGGSRQAPSRVNVAAAGEGELAGDTASFVGQVAYDGGLTGRLAATGTDLSQLAAAAALPFKAEAQLRSASGGVVFSDIAATIGGSVLRGAATLRAGVPRLDLLLSAVRVELDPWVSQMRVGGYADLPIGLDLTAEAAELGGGTLRQLHLELESSETALKIRQATALLPGQAALWLAGDMQRGDMQRGDMQVVAPARPRFNGEARLDAPALRTTLQWLDAAVSPRLPALPPGVLERAAVRARIEAGPGMLAVTGIDGTLDGNAVSGDLRIRPGDTSRGGGEPPRPVLDVSIELAALTLDAWLPSSFSPDLLADPARHGGGFDLDLKVFARTASIADEPIGPLRLDAAIEPAAGGETRLTLRRLEARPRGIDVAASFILGPGGHIADGRLDATAVDTAELADLVPPAWRPVAAFWRGPATASLRLAGPLEAISARFALDVADARLEASPLIDLRTGGWSGPATLRHPGAARMLALLGMPGANAWLGDGSLSVIAQLSHTRAVSGGAPSRIVADSLDITAGAARLSAPFSIELGAVPSLSARVNADTLALPSPNGEMLLPVAQVRGWQAKIGVQARETLLDSRPVLGRSSATLSLADGVLLVSPFTIQLGAPPQPGVLTGSATLDTARQPPALTLDAALREFRIHEPATELKLGLAAGQADAVLQLSASGYSVGTLASTLQGEVALNVEDGILTGFDLFRIKLLTDSADPRRRTAIEAALHDALAGGPTVFDRLELRGSASAGILTLHDTRLSGVAGSVDFTGTIGLAGSKLDLKATLRPAIDNPPEIGLRLTGSLEDPRRSLELSTFLQWLAARPPP